eukprot:2302_1
MAASQVQTDTKQNELVENKNIAVDFKAEDENQVYLYDINHENKLINTLLDIVFNFNESNWSTDKIDDKIGMKTYHKMISDSEYCTRGELRWKHKKIMNFYDHLLARKEKNKYFSWTANDQYDDMRFIDDDHVFIYHKPSVLGAIQYIISPRDFCTIRTRFKIKNYVSNCQSFDICGSLGYSVNDNHPWYVKENKQFIRSNVNYHSFMLIDYKNQMIERNSKKK